MSEEYAGVTTRFLRNEERLVVSEEKEMPLVIEARDQKDVSFLQNFLTTNSTQFLADVSQYGAVLLRGFDVATEADFEKVILSIQKMHGISEAFMSEEGRVPVGGCQYILYTNAVYKTGGTLYLGGFHSENYYSSDVPSYISFGCFKPSTQGGETGLVNMEKVYQKLGRDLQERLEKQTFLAASWLVSDVAKRYSISTEAVLSIAKHFKLPVIGQGRNMLVLLYKPNVFVHPDTNKKALQINLFEVDGLNEAMRKYFMADYQGKAWFWHRFVWKLPRSVLKAMEYLYIAFASFFYSPIDSLSILKSKIHGYFAAKAMKALPLSQRKRVGSCFNKNDVNQLARLMRQYYCSCLWQKGDILVVDNRQVVHAGMPGSGPRVVRAMICNPLEMDYSFAESGVLNCHERTTETVGRCMAAGKIAY